MASSKFGNPGLGPWYQDHNGNIVAGTPTDKHVNTRGRTVQDMKVEEILSVFDSITKELGEDDWTELQWERIRNGWVEFALKLAEVKLASQQSGVDTSDDEYPTLENVRVDNFDDAMKILSRNYLT